jgi:hypothetical protein
MKAAGLPRRLAALIPVAVLTGASAIAPRAAHANGALPDSFGILLPADRPDQILLATNFGMVSTQDGGKTWEWSCEQDKANLAKLYQLGPSPGDRLFALSTSGLIFSDDGTCGWSVSGWSASVLVTDYFPDPRDPMHIVAIGLPNTPDLEAEGIYASHDGGVSFGDAQFKAPIKGGLTGIEIARGDPRIVYAAMYESPGIHPSILRSEDGGATWGAPVDIEREIGANSYRILAVDPEDPQKLYLRTQEPLQESLAISQDGGMTFQKPVSFPLRMTAFARLASGTILVAGFQFDNQGLQTPLAYRSMDGGKTFFPWTTPSLRALAERGGKLYAAADNAKDPFALGVSTDEGATFTALMKFSDVARISACVQAACARSCATLAMQKLWSNGTCAPAGCACAVDRDRGGAGALGVALLVVVIAWRTAVRARRRRARR